MEFPGKQVLGWASTEIMMKYHRGDCRFLMAKGNGKSDILVVQYLSSPELYERCIVPFETSELQY
jgi:hypothetical protein